MFELPQFKLFEKTRARFKRKKKQAPSRPKKPMSPKVRFWVLVLVDASIGVLMRALTWGMIAFIAVIDILAVLVTLIIAYQDVLPEALVDFVKVHVFSSQKHIRLTLQMLNLDGIADMMRDGLKALGFLWLTVTFLTFGATVLTRYIWNRRTRKKMEANAKLEGKPAPGEILIPLHDPLTLQMDDEFSRFVHLYAFYLDLRCRSPEDASRVAQTMDALKTALSQELVKLAEGRVIQVKREDATTALSDAARQVTSGGIVGVILRTSDYHRLRKPESAIVKPADSNAKPKMKMSTSWGAKPYQDLAAISAAEPAAAPPAAAAPAPAPAPAEAAEAPVEEPPKPLADAASMVAAKARNVLDGLRG